MDSQVTIYVRFSSLKQEGGNSIERQTNICRSHCERKGWGEPNILIDKGKSAWKGHHLSKGELGKFADKVRRGEIPVGHILLVEDLDRLSRLHPLETQSWLMEMTKAGLRIAIVNGDELFDFNGLRDSLPKLVMLMVNAFATNAPSVKTSTRLLEVHKAKRERAKTTKEISCARGPGWLKAVPDGAGRKWEVIPARAETVVMIYERLAEGWGFRAIASWLNEHGIPAFGKHWEHTHLRMIVTTRAAEGLYLPGTGEKSWKAPTGDVIEGYFPRVVDADLAQRARAQVESRRGNGRPKGGRAKLDNLFTGLVRCGHCHSPMYHHRSGKEVRKHSFRCTNAAAKRGCDTGWIQYQPFETAALDSILHLALDDKFFVRPDETRRIAVRLAEARHRVLRLEEGLTNLTRAICQSARKVDPESASKIDPLGAAGCSRPAA